MTGEEGSSAHNRVPCEGPLPSVFHIGMLSGDPLLSITAVRNGDVCWSAFSTAILVSLRSQEQVASVVRTLSMLSNYSTSHAETGF